MDNSEYYKDKICIITGANSGIGYAVSEELLKRGAIVYLAGRNPEKVANAAKQLSSYKDQIHTLIVDVTDQHQVQKAIEDTVAEAGRLDFLFNNAGVGFKSPYENATLKDWKTIIDTNLWSVIYGVHTAVPIMLKQGSGHIVNTSSVSGIIPTPFSSLYSLTKFGVTGFTESLKYEYVGKGIYFSTICPSNIATPIFKKDMSGNVNDEVKIPDDAYSVDKTAVLILDQVSQQKGIIVIPEEPNTYNWNEYIKGEDEELFQFAHALRALYEEDGNY